MNAYAQFICYYNMVKKLKIGKSLQEGSKPRIGSSRTEAERPIGRDDEGKVGNTLSFLSYFPTRYHSFVLFTT